MAIGENKPSGTWWKVLLGVIGGFFLGIGSVAGAAAIAGTMVKTKDLLGGNADKLIGKDYQEKTIMQIIMDAVGGKIKVETLGDLNNITPLIGEYMGGVKTSLNEIGCELTDADIYGWKLQTLSNDIVGAVKNAKLINVLSKGKLSNPDPVIKYLSYHTVDGEFVYDADDKLIDHTLSDMLDDAGFVQRKVDNMSLKMLFTEEDIGKSKLLTSLQDKTVKELANEGAFDDVKLDAVITVDSSSPKILQTFVDNDVTVGSMGDAINDLKMGEVIEIDESSPKILQSLENTKVEEIGDKINTLTIGETTEITESSPKILKAIKDFTIDGLGDTVDNLTIDDVIEDRESVKFLNKLPADTKIKEIGTAVNNINLLDAFEDNVYPDGKLNSTWKYMLIEKTETWIEGNPTKESNPFKIGEDDCYNSTKYTLGGDGTGDDKGINGLIDNMSDNMQRATLDQLDKDGIVDLDDDFLIKELTGTWASFAPAGKTTFGELTLNELTTLITKVTSVS